LIVYNYYTVIYILIICIVGEEKKVTDVVVNIGIDHSHELSDSQKETGEWNTL